jgi:hypothetical protein
MEDHLNGKRNTEAVSSIPYQNVMIDAIQILRSETDLVSKQCLEVYCGSGTDPECPQQEEFKEFFVSGTETKDDYEKRLDGFISDFVSKVFAEFKFDASLSTIRKKSSGTFMTQCSNQNYKSRS